MSMFNEEERAAIHVMDPDRTESSSMEASSKSTSLSWLPEGTPKKSIEGREEATSKEVECVDLPSLPPVEQEIGDVLGFISSSPPHGVVEASIVLSSETASGEPSIAGPSALQPPASSEATL